MKVILNYRFLRFPHKFGTLGGGQQHEDGDGTGGHAGLQSDGSGGPHGEQPELQLGTTGARAPHVAKILKLFSLYYLKLKKKIITARRLLLTWVIIYRRTQAALG